MKASVILCSHNPRIDYLTRVLAALSAQSLPTTEWDLIVIDNASSDSLETCIDISWHPSGRIVRENELGLTPARLRGISEASGDFFVFVDDDKVLSPPFLATASRISQDYPYLGAWGGSIAVEYEQMPPAWVKELLRLPLRSSRLYVH